MPACILIVDDEPSILEVLRYNLEKAGFRVMTARDGQGALRAAREQNPDLMILDLMLPGMDGLEVCRTIRSESSMPIIMLTALDEEVDRVVGLELGADDYMVKPFSVRELLARVRSVLRRSAPDDRERGARVSLGRLTVDSDRHLTLWDDQPVELSPLEFKLLETLAQHAEQVLTREQLLDRVWGYAYHGETRVVDTCIRRLRAKLRALDPQAAECVCTVRGVGYKITHEH
jgi:DNA-binding response OmpR family regulator